MEGTNKLVSLFLLLLVVIGLSLFMFYKLGLLGKFFPSNRFGLSSVLSSASTTPTPSATPKPSNLETVGKIINTPTPILPLDRVSPTATLPRPTTGATVVISRPPTTTAQNTYPTQYQPQNTFETQPRTSLQNIKSIPTAGTPTLIIPVMTALGAIGMRLRKKRNRVPIHVTFSLARK